jgi:hypothetical protein
VELGDGPRGMLAVGGGINIFGAEGCCLPVGVFFFPSEGPLGVEGLEPYLSSSCCVESYLVAALSLSIVVSLSFSKVSR